MYILYCTSSVGVCIGCLHTLGVVHVWCGGVHQV